ncbi:MAG TPA: DUF2905 domain-containing protein [Phycisphaerae bacterium]|nr:DUF2905 domain-containing protein [Phycisphaerae bacterium]
MPQFGKLLIVAGVVIVAIGLLVTFADRIPLIGRLPGDIQIRRKGLVIWVPLASSLLLSLLLTLILWLLSRGK